MDEDQLKAMTPEHMTAFLAGIERSVMEKLKHTLASGQDCSLSMAEASWTLGLMQEAYSHWEMLCIEREIQKKLLRKLYEIVPKEEIEAMLGPHPSWDEIERYHKRTMTPEEREEYDRKYCRRWWESP